MDQRLILAAQEGDIDSLYSLLDEDPYVLEKIDAVPFIETPIHIAASLGQTDFAVEVMILKPSWGRKLNRKGFSPIHLSIEKGNFETVRGLIAMDKGLVSVKGKQGMTPLHCAVVEGRIKILKEMLLACPDSIKDVTARRETALHLAVKNNKFKAWKVLMRHIYNCDEETIFQWKDNEGHTMLHLMVLGSQLKMIKLFCRCSLIDSMSFGINARNGSGQTAMDIIEDHQQLHGTQRNSITKQLLEMKGILYESGAFLRKMPNRNNRFSIMANSTRNSMRQTFQLLVSTYTSMNKDAQNAMLVVAALITTVTFQVGVNPPGGVWQDTGISDNQPHMVGTSVLAVVRPTHYTMITVFNFMAFVFSVSLMILLTMKLPVRGMMTVSLFLATATYLVSISAVNWDETPFVSGTYFASLSKKFYHFPTFALFILVAIMPFFCFFLIPGVKSGSIRQMDDNDDDDSDDDNDDNEGCNRDVITATA